METADAIANKIKNGSDLYLELWNQLKPFIRIKAYDFMREHGINYGYIDDMLQESFIVLSEAVSYYEPGAGKSFVSVLTSWFLPKAFKTACYGGIGAKNLHDPINNYKSIYLTDSSGDESNETILDLIPDEVAQEAFENIENADYRKSLNAFIRKGAEALRDEQQKVLLLFILAGGSIQEAHADKLLGDKPLYSYRTVWNSIRYYFKRWCRGSGKYEADKVGLSLIVGTSLFYSSSLSSWKEHHNTSCVERLVLEFLESDC